MLYRRGLCIKDGNLIDPACGTGGMLIEAIRNMDDAKQSYGKIYGQEKNLSTSAIARMNLFLHGAKEFKIRREDTLRKPMFIHNGQLQQFDCVLANEAVICGLIPEKARNIKEFAA